MQPSDAQANEGFFATLKSAIYDPAFYKDAANFESRAAWRYYLRLAALLALASTIVVGVPMSLVAKKYVATQGERLLTQVPQDYAITVTDGVATSPAPLTVKLELDGVDQPDLPTNLVYVDTTRDWSPEMDDAADALIVVARDGIGLPEESATQRFADYDDKEIEGTLAYADLVTFRDRARAVTPWVLLLGNVLVFVLAFLAQLYTLVWLLLGAFVVRLVARARGLALGYEQAYRASLYLATLPMVVHLGLGVLPSSFAIDWLRASWVLFVALLAGMAYLNLPAGPAAAPSEGAAKPPSA